MARPGRRYASSAPDSTVMQRPALALASRLASNSRPAPRSRRAVRPESSTGPAGVSPVQVGTGAPGSWPELGLERGRAVAGRQEPLWREQVRGPQHEVNPAASSELQRERRAAHVTVKAMSATHPSGNGVAGLLGVWGTARARGLVGNRRDPSAPLLSKQGRSYKPMVKSSGAQRESEGVVVPLMARNTTRPEGRAPALIALAQRGRAPECSGLPELTTPLGSFPATTSVAPSHPPFVEGGNVVYGVALVLAST